MGCRDRDCERAKSEVLRIRLTRDVAEAVHDEAKRQGVTISALLRHWIGTRLAGTGPCASFDARLADAQAAIHELRGMCEAVRQPGDAGENVNFIQLL